MRIQLYSIEPKCNEAKLIEDHDGGTDEAKCRETAGYLAETLQAKRRKFNQGHPNQRVVFLIVPTPTQSAA